MKLSRLIEDLTSWFGSSVVKDEHGNPLRMYRGQRRVPSPDKFVTTKGRATPAFTPDPHVASVYAMHQQAYGEPEYKRGSNVGVYYLKMEKPFDARPLGETASLWEIINELNWDFRFNPAPKTIGIVELESIISGLDDLQGKANFHVEFNGDLRDWDDCLQVLSKADNETDDEDRTDQVESMLMDVDIDVYAVIDTHEFTDVLMMLGYDGAIHKDVFDVGMKYYQGDKEKIEAGVNADAVIDTYRPFYQKNIKSAIGNRGTYSSDSDDVTESLE